MTITDNTVQAINTALLQFQSAGARAKKTNTDNVNVTETETIDIDLPEFEPAELNKWGKIKYGKLAICFGKFTNQASTGRIIIENRYDRGITNFAMNYGDHSFPFNFKTKPIIFFQPIKGWGYPGADYTVAQAYCQALNNSTYRVWDGFEYSNSWPYSTTYADYYLVVIGQI